MGNRPSSASDHSRGGTSNIFLTLHKSWTYLLTDKWIRRRLNRRKTNVFHNSMSEVTSEFSYCSCSQCLQEDGISTSSFFSDLFDIGAAMSPNLEESRRIDAFQWNDDALAKEKQRPPIYNPEDYALSLKKWGRRPPANGPGLYSNMTPLENDSTKTQGNTFRDYRNPMITSSCEMTLRQFGTVTELLSKLKSDLRLAYPSFVQEFVADPLDGVTLLLELLRAIQLSQANGNNAAGSSATTGKILPSIQRRALLDELTCLQCIICCCVRYTESIRKLAASSAGLFTLAVCIMSNVNKSRIIALQLLTKACEPTGNGNSTVSEALSTLRLRFGEPVRFRFLVGMLTSAGGQGELLATGMKFINTFLDTAGSTQKRIYVQAELEQAGFDIAAIKKNISINSHHAEQIFSEMDRWEKNHVDVETVTIRLKEAEKENDSLRDKVLLLERRIQILQEEKGILMSLEQCLKERCSELEDEVISLKSGKSPKKSSNFSTKRDGSTPEDEGISSSERSLTPEELDRDPSDYEMYRDDTLPLKANIIDIEDEEEDETTIEEVIEELRNIINDAETEEYNSQELSRLKQEEMERIRMEEAQVRSKIQMRVDSNVSIDDSVVGSECEIVPSNLHPQPPRKTRSLVHLYIPTEDYYNKEIFFENETAFTSDESSDSLLSASKCKLPRVEKDSHNSNRKTSNSTMDEKEKDNRLMQQANKNTKFYRDSNRAKSKSLDRIDNGLDAMVDIVLTEKIEQRSDLCNSSRVNVRGKQYENPKMFLPAKKFEERPMPENRYYFPRVQEKRATNNSFLIKRGHTNAGMYSGQNISTSLSKKSDYYTTTGSKNSSSKLTDYPSGLY